MLPIRREQLTDVMQYSASQTSQLPGEGVPRDMPLAALELCLEGRMVISGQTVAGVIFPEAPASLIRRVELTGTRNNGKGSITLVDARGEELHRAGGFFNTCLPIGVEVRDTPGSGGTIFPAALANTANGSYDFRSFFMVPIALPFSSLQDWYESVLDPVIFSQLRLRVTWGSGQANFVSGGTLTFALSAFGSGSGVPTLRVTRVVPLAASGLGRYPFKIGQYHYLWNSSYVQTGTALAASASAPAKITDLKSGTKTRAIMLRQYSENASVTGQIDQSGSASLARIGDGSNIGIYNWRVRVNGTDKWFVRNSDQREENRRNYNYPGSLFPQGYTMLDFARMGMSSQFFDTRGYGQVAARFELAGEWLNLASTDRLDILQIEQVPIS